MGPAKELHEQDMIMNHVSLLASLRASCDTNKEEIQKTDAEVDKMNTRVGCIEKDLTVLKVKFATYSAIAVFLANILYNVISKIVGA